MKFIDDIFETLREENAYFNEDTSADETLSGFLRGIPQDINLNMENRELMKDSVFEKRIWEENLTQMESVFLKKKEKKEGGNGFILTYTYENKNSKIIIRFAEDKIMTEKLKFQTLFTPSSCVCVHISARAYGRVSDIVEMLGFEDIKDNDSENE